MPLTFISFCDTQPLFSSVVVPPVLAGNDCNIDEEYAANCSGLRWSEGFSCEISRTDDNKWDELIASISTCHVKEDSPVVPDFDGDDSPVHEEYVADCSGLGWFEGFSCELERPTMQIGMNSSRVLLSLLAPTRENQRTPPPSLDPTILRSSRFILKSLTPTPIRKS